jgi:hypothetical protein
LPESEHAGLVFPHCVGVYYDGFLLVLGRSVHLGTVAPLGLVATALVEQFPVAFGEVVHEGVELASAGLGELLLEIEEQFEGVGLDKELAHELIFA